MEFRWAWLFSWRAPAPSAAPQTFSDQTRSHLRVVYQLQEHLQKKRKELTRIDLYEMLVYSSTNQKVEPISNLYSNTK